MICDYFLFKALPTVICEIETVYRSANFPQMGLLNSQVLARADLIDSLVVSDFIYLFIQAAYIMTKLRAIVD